MGIKILILGSGFSKPIGLPLYKEWGKEILSNLNREIKTKNDSNDKWWLEEILKEITSYLNDDQKTIDDFFQNLDNEKLKKLIDSHIIFGPIFWNKCRDFYKSPNCPYMYKLKLDPFYEIITFNYDQLFEYYLKKNYGSNQIKKIIHAHGYIDFVFSTCLNYKSIYSVFYDFKNFKIDNETSTYHLALSYGQLHHVTNNDEWLKIEKIVFVGFGFHISNLNNLGLHFKSLEEKGLKNWPKMVIVDPKFDDLNKQDEFYKSFDLYKKTNIVKNFTFIAKAIEHLSEADWELINY